MIAGDLLGERARLTPAKTAVIEVHTRRRYTYAELDRRASAMAHLWTAQCGLSAGDRVGILAGNCVDYIDSFFAAGKSGVVLVPLNTRLTAAELTLLIEDAGIRLLLHSRHYRETAEALRVERWVSLEELPPAPDAPFAPVPRDPEDLWCLLYTSGTTGRPKGVMLPHRMILWNAYNTVAGWQLRDDDIAPVFTPMHHAGGLSVFLTPMVAIGGTVVLHHRFDASDVWRAIERERATLVFGVPTIFKMLMEAPEFPTIDLGSVRWAISGGAPLPEYLIDAYRRRGIVLKQGYGLTEAGVNCFAMTSEEATAKPGSIGKPLPFARTRLSDAEGREVAAGETGELWLAGPHVAKGFWNQPEATAAAFAEGAWLRTGDLAHRDADGFFYIDGRIKDMFISGGVNVYPAEIEAVLLQHPAVEEAAVIGVPDPKWGERGAAFVVARPGMAPSAEELTQWLGARLARYKSPRVIRFVSALPRTPYGKVVKPELRKWIQDQQGDSK